MCWQQQVPLVPAAIRLAGYLRLAQHARPRASKTNVSLLVRQKLGMTFQQLKLQ
jgi:hypothetical protein